MGKIQTTKYKFAQIWSFRRPQNIEVEKNPFDSTVTQFPENLKPEEASTISQRSPVSFKSKDFVLLKMLTWPEKINRFWNRFDF